MYVHLCICVGILIFKGKNPEDEMNTGKKKIEQGFFFVGLGFFVFWIFFCLPLDLLS